MTDGNWPLISAVTIEFTPRLEREPRTRPQLKMTNLDELSRYCFDSDTLDRNLKWLSWRT